MNHPTIVRACPLCGSKQIKVIQADAAQAAAGVTCVLKCECGAIVKLSVLTKGLKESSVEVDED